MTRSRWLWPLLLGVCAFAGLVARLWNVDFDARQHQHPDERHWAITSSELERAEAPAPHGTLLGPVLDWLDGDRSPANAYRGTEHFQYGPAMLAAARGTAGWLHDGVVRDEQPASLIAHGLDAVGIDLLDDDGQPRFDDGYQVDLIGRVLGAFIDSLTIVVVGLIGRGLGGRRIGVVSAALYATSVMAIQHAHFLSSEPLVGLLSACTILVVLRIDRTDHAQVWRGGLVAGLCAGAALAAKLSAVSVAIVPVALCTWLLISRRRAADSVRLGALFAGMLVAFRVVHPGAYNGLGLTWSARFTADVDEMLSVRDVDWPPAVQWANRSGFVDGVLWLVQFTLGPGAFIAAVLGGIVCWRRRATFGRWNVAVLFAPLLVSAVVVLRSLVFTGRYLVPIMPVVYVLAGFGVVALWDLRPTRPRLRLAGRTTAVVLCGLAVLWAAAFVQGVYGHTNTRIEASRWIEANVPRGAVLTNQAWDDAMPLRVPGIDRDDWQHVTLALWDTDTVAKTDALARQLADVDYVVESSARVWATVVRMPAKYPSTISFFEALDSGALGFERVATFTSPPRLSLFGTEIWRLDDAGAEEAFSVYDHPEVRIWQKTRVLEHDEMVAALDPWAAATAVHVLPLKASSNGLTQFPEEASERDQVGTYDEAFDTSANPWWHVAGWLALLALSTVAAFVLFLPLLRRLPDAGAGVAPLLGLAVPAVGIFVLVAWCNLAFTRSLVAAVYALWLGAAAIVAHRRRDDIAGVWVVRRRTIVTAASAALVAFVVLIVLRAANPDLWHPYRAGEKPFELTMLTEVMRTRTLPPPDTWFAGGTRNYYYGGYLMLSLPARLLRTSPTVVMNLALAVFSGCAASGAFGLGAALRARSARRSSAQVRRAGLLAAACVLFVPNPQAVIDAVRWLFDGSDRTFDWWAPSRVVSNSYAVTEFPSWSLFFGDVHPHVMNLAVLLAVFTLCLAWYLALLHRRTSWALAAAVGVLVGLVRATNTWDFPLAAAAAAAAPMLVFVRTRRWRPSLRDALAAAVGIVGVWLPYTRRVEVYDAGVDAVQQRTPWVDWASHWGFFAVCTLVAVAPAAWRWARGRPTVLVPYALILAGCLVGGPDRYTQITCLMLAGAAAAAALVQRVRRAPGVSVVGLALLAAGWLALAVIEQVSVKNDFGRMNTVFKGWYQVWLLLAVGSAVCLTALLATARRGPARHGLRALVTTSLAGGLLFALVAVPERLDDRMSEGGWSLDGEAALQRTDAAPDVPLLHWLRANARGLVTVAEAPGDGYRWSGRVATYVGLPTVIGWPYHEQQQRRPYAAAVEQRRSDMRELYTTRDPLRVDQILASYDVRYVMFGVTEQAIDGVVADGTTLLKAACVSVAVRSEAGFVASVDPECLRSVAIP